MDWWQQLWPNLETEMARMDREQAMVGQGECQKCNKLAAENNALRLQREVDHASFRQREELMQAQIDALRDEKQDSVYRSGGFNTENVGD